VTLTCCVEAASLFHAVVLFAEEAEPLSAVWRPHPAVWLLEKAVSPLLLLCIAVNAAW